MSPLPLALHIGNGWFPEHAGGLERVFHALWQHLPAQGFGFRGLVLGSDRIARDTGHTVVAGAPLHAPLPRRWYGLRKAFRERTASEPPALIAGHFALNVFPLLDRLRDFPFVMHFHGPWAEESQVEGGGTWQHRLKLQLERTVYRRATRCVVLSRAFRHLLCETYGIHPERVAVIPGGVEVERFDLPLPRTEARRRLQLSQDRPILLLVRRLTRRMGLLEVLEAVARLKEHHPELLVLVAGRGPLKEHLERTITTDRLGEQVRLLGFVPDEALPLYYRAADLTLMPSQHLEGFGLVTLESLAAGTPVMATPVGGLPEILAPLHPGLILDDTTPEALTHGIRQWLEGRRILPDAAACQAHVRTYYTWERMARDTANLYRSLQA